MLYNPNNMLVRHQKIVPDADARPTCALFTLALVLLFVGACQFDSAGVPALPALPDEDPCGGACAAGDVCGADGTCTSSCAVGTTDCNGVCINTDSDPAHCGSCGNVCSVNHICDGQGACQMCPSERLVPTACELSATEDLGACEQLYDLVEFASPPQRSGLKNTACDDAGGTSFCVYDSECPNGCIQDMWIRFDLGAPRFVHRIRYMADWWAKRPDNWQLWVSDDPAMLPGAGAVLATEGVGMANPWQCVDGESCAEASVPDACCPDGRNQPQNTADVGEFWPRFDELEFSGQVGRYWYYVIKDTRDRDHLNLFEIELFGSDCI